MKNYNKPVVEITGIEVKDIITSSLYGALVDADAKSAFDAFTSNTTASAEEETLLDRKSVV